MKLARHENFPAVRQGIGAGGFDGIFGGDHLESGK
jgi:hypothetical protein